MAVQMRTMLAVVAAGVIADSLLWGRYPLHLKPPRVLTPAEMGLLTLPVAADLAQIPTASGVR